MNELKMKDFEIVKFVSDDVELDVRISPYEETLWLSYQQMAILFGVDRTRINRHVNNILSENELDNSTCAENAQVHFEGNREIKRIIKLCNLDMIIAVGYRVNSKRGTFFRKWANKILKQYLLKGYVINESRVTVSNENYIELTNKVANIDNRLSNVEKSLQKDLIEDKTVLFNGQFYDAYSLLEQIFESADNEIILMDNYIDRTILDRLTSKKHNVQVTIYTSFNKSRITQNDINAFNIQYPTVTLIETLNLHDRYIIIDSTKLYHVGASIKGAGKKIFSIHESDSSLITIILSKL